MVAKKEVGSSKTKTWFQQQNLPNRLSSKKNGVLVSSPAAGSSKSSWRLQLLLSLPHGDSRFQHASGAARLPVAAKQRLSFQQRRLPVVAPWPTSVFSLAPSASMQQKRSLFATAPGIRSYGMKSAGKGDRRRKKGAASQGRKREGKAAWRNPWRHGRRAAT